MQGLFDIQLGLRDLSAFIISTTVPIYFICLKLAALVMSKLCNFGDLLGEIGC